jgi:hypothetical protein
MAFKLSKEDSRAKTELLSQAREKYIALGAQIEAFNVMLEAARVCIDGAHKEYAASVTRLQDFAEKTAGAAGKALKARPKDWQESDAGIEIGDWTSCYQAFLPVVPAVVFPQEIDSLDDALLTNFEELPDAP